MRPIKLLNWIKNYFSKVISKFLKNFYFNIFDCSILCLGYSQGDKKTALLSGHPLILTFTEEKIERHHPFAKMQLIILTLLIKRGYKVDYVSYKKKSYSDKKYDLVIGLGDQYRNAKLKKNGKRILLLEENDPKFSYENELKRVKNFNIKYKKKYKINRSKKFYLSSDIYLANFVMAHATNIVKNIKQIYKTDCYYTPVFGIQTKKIKYKNNNPKVLNLMWLGGPAFIHKGLDIVIEAIKNDARFYLHVCGIKESNVPRSLKRNNNVSFYGFIDIKSSLYKNLVSICSHSILLSASEGFPTSIVTNMYSGLIPIISGIEENLPSYAISLKENEVNDKNLKKILCEQYKLINNSYVNNLRNIVSEYSNQFYSEEIFQTYFIKAFDEITQTKINY